MALKKQFQRFLGKTKAAEEMVTENDDVKSEVATETDEAEASEARLGNLTLLDRELIAMLELVDRRVAALEHDLWSIKSKIAALTDVPTVGEREVP